MSDEYRVIRVDDTKDLEERLQAAADEGFAFVGTLSSRLGSPVVIMRRDRGKPQTMRVAI